jgi:hypothetical protein
MTTRASQEDQDGASRAAALEHDRREVARSYGLRGFRIEALGSLLLLDGNAPSYKAKRSAGAAADFFAGHLMVVNRLRVMPAEEPVGGRNAA